MKNLSYIISIIFLLCALGFVSYKTYVKVPDDSKEKALRDSINYLQKRIDSSLVRQEQLELAYDSVCRLEPEIKYKTREKIKFILTTATPSELDSIIRATISKRKTPRYN